jgi:hypothetical protein
MESVSICFEALQPWRKGFAGQGSFKSKISWSTANCCRRFNITRPARKAAFSGLNAESP